MVVGNSILLDFSGVVDDDSHSEKTWKEIISKLVEIGNMNMLHFASYKFTEVIGKEGAVDSKQQNGGITAFALLSESHISVHTWPEFGKVMVDIFTCGSTAKLEDMIEYLRTNIQHQEMIITRLERGEQT